MKIKFRNSSIIVNDNSMYEMSTFGLVKLSTFSIGRVMSKNLKSIKHYE